MSYVDEKYDFTWRLENTDYIAKYGPVFTKPNCFLLKFNVSVKRVLQMEFIQLDKSQNYIKDVKIKASIRNSNGIEYSKYSVENWPWRLEIQLPAIVDCWKTLDFTGKILYKRKVKLPYRNGLGNCADTLLSNMKNMYKKRCQGDVTFTIDSQELFAHRLFLQFCSPVFEKMLTEDTNLDNIAITDIEYNVFDQFLLYLYTQELNVKKDVDMLCGLYSAAVKYKVANLLKDCSKVLIKTFNVTDVTKSLVLGYKYKDDVLLNEARKYMTINFKRVGTTPQWANIVNTDVHLASETLAFVTSKVARFLPSLKSNPLLTLSLPERPKRLYKNIAFRPFPYEKG